MTGAMTIGILETGRVAAELEARYGRYDGMFQRLLRRADPTLVFRTWSVLENDFPTGVDAVDGWLVTGSRHGVYEDLPWIRRLEAFLRDAVAAEVPVVGVCFGHQVLASALGGRVEKSDKGWGVGVQRYEMLPSPAWAGAEAAIGPELALNSIHQDQVITPPPGATVLATSEFCRYAALAYGPAERPTAVSVQAHPEFEAEFLGDLLRARAGVAFPTAVADAGVATLGAPVDAGPVAGWIVAFLRAAAARRAPAAAAE